MLLLAAVIMGLVIFAVLTASNRDPSQGATRAGENSELVSQHVLAVIVPFRNRFEELLEFVPHMTNFLDSQNVSRKIFVINQVDSHRFNRASLINAGFLLSRDECDYLVMHDVDLLPLNPALDYRYPAGDIYHVSAPNLHPKYHYPTFVGGILIVTRDAFEMLNGFSNRFWGWGREDDEFYHRIIDAGMTVERPANITTGYRTFKHDHDPVRRPRDYKRVGDQKLWSNKRDYMTGLSTVRYFVNATYELHVSGKPATIYNVMLECDTDRTPWCDDTDG